jgi:hypothetical protein
LGKNNAWRCRDLWEGEITLKGEIVFLGGGILLLRSFVTGPGQAQIAVSRMEMNK